MAYELSISKKVDATGRSELSLRLRLGKIDQQASTHLYVNPQHTRQESYLSPKGRKSKRLVLVVSRNKTSEVHHTEEVKEKLDCLIAYLDQCLQNEGTQNVTKGWLSEKIDTYILPSKEVPEPETKSNDEVEPEATLDIFDIFEDFVEKRNVSVSQKRHYLVFMRILQRYERYQQLMVPKFRLSYDVMDEKFMQELDSYMKDEYKLLKRFPSIIKAIPESRMPGERGQNTVNGYFKKLKAFILWSIDHEYTTNNPFRKFKIVQDVYGTPYYITIDERHQIEQADLSKRPGLAVQRDIFVFHCCIGCRVSDLRQLTRANVINGAVHYIARKTKNGHPLTIKVPLNQTALTILERYDDPERESLLPFISDQKYNDAIKEIFTIAGVTRNVVVRNSLTGEQEIRPINEIASSHMARRTFVGNIYKKFKDQSLVSELSGHAPNSPAFARYREVDEEMKRDMVSAID